MSITSCWVMDSMIAFSPPERKHDPPHLLCASSVRATNLIRFDNSLALSLKSVMERLVISMSAAS